MGWLAMLKVVDSIKRCHGVLLTSFMVPEIAGLQIMLRQTGKHDTKLYFYLQKALEVLTRSFTQRPRLFMKCF